MKSTVEPTLSPANLSNIGIRPRLMVPGVLSNIQSFEHVLTDKSLWEKVAVSRTQPDGRVLGVDIIPAQPPKGVSTIQGNFLAPEVQAYVREFLRDPSRGRPLAQMSSPNFNTHDLARQQYMHMMTSGNSETACPGGPEPERKVDVVLSDMSAPWDQTTGFWKRSLSDPYYRMMNTSGVSFRDHAGSMVCIPVYNCLISHLSNNIEKDLCRAALQFSFDVLKTGGHFVCKFYQGVEDKDFEKQLNELFQRVHRLKPESSRSVRTEYTQYQFYIRLLSPTD